MTLRRIHFVFLILLTLLQGFAPLLHAHTFGNERVAGVHLYDVAGSQSSSFDAQVLAVHGEEYPAIGMAQEYRQDSAFVFSASASGETLPAPFSPEYSCSNHLHPVNSNASPPAGRYGHFIPFSQAPPLALI